MKEKMKYESPRLETVFYSADDIITTSGFGGEIDIFTKPQSAFEDEGENTYTLPRVDIND